MLAQEKLKKQLQGIYMIIANMKPNQFEGSFRWVVMVT